MRHLLLATGFVIASAPFAMATGGLYCEIDDENLRFSFAAVKTRGMGNPIFEIKVAADIKVPGVPEGLKTPDLAEDGRLVHSWIFENEARLLYYTETPWGTGGIDGNMTLAVLTRVFDDYGSRHTGEYRLSINVPDKEPIKVVGMVVCDIE